ncbi:MAG: hypothetical protein JW915_15730 [Chitinispirillaceae bacterium]|nr:hypothetical protein [Chitinispirillaceae bacterium]
MLNRSVLLSGVCMLFVSCAVMVNGPEDDEQGGGFVKPPVLHQRVRIQTKNMFPFENNRNWWNYTESSGNKLQMRVTDTISDDNVLYYRVAFQELRVDTTDDWFKSSSSGSVMFGQSLTGLYDQFLPREIDSINGSFSCGINNVRYNYYDSLVSGGVMYHKVLRLKYDYPVIHGFEEILLAERIGIIKMVDYNGRWPVNYLLDSCSVDDVVMTF